MKDLIATIRPLARRLAAQQRRMKTAGLFANDRELLDCPHCGLREDVLISGLLITYREPGLHQDTGLRFQELTADTFRCPSCGQTVCEPLAEDMQGGAFPRARNQAPQTRRTCKRREAQSMSAKPGTAAPTGRNKPAQGKERSDAALGHASQNTASPEGAKEGGELPRGWSEQRIEQLFAPLEDGRTLHQGWSPQCDKIPSPSEDVWGVLKTTSIQAGEFQPEHNKLLPPGLEPRPMIEVKEGDILLTCAGPRVRCGVSCLVRQTRKRLMMSGKMYRFRVNPEEHDARYIEAFLQTERARQAIDKMKTGSSDSGLNLTHERFRQFPVPVPATVDEQRRIVAEIEKQFTRLEAGVAALRRVQANLKRYRAAVLKAACEGRLVPTEAAPARSQRST